MLAANGCDVRAGGLVGADHAADFGSFLRANGIAPALVTVDEPTRENVMVSDGRGQELKLNRPGLAGLAFSEADLARCLDVLLEHASVCVMSGSLPERYPADAYARAIRQARQRGVVCVLDTGGEALEAGLAAGPSVIKPNLEEFMALAGPVQPGTAGFLAALRKLAAGCDVLAVSDGPRGCWFVRDGEVWHGLPPPVNAVDSTGAGDALLGQFCADYFGAGARELAPETVARAVAAGAAAVEQQGTPMPDMTRVRALVPGVRVQRPG
jgi:1-phosphofructokinase family hexose kinase